jgi:hypothetical protein
MKSPLNLLLLSDQQNKRTDALAVLSRMKKNLEDYTSKPDHSKKYVEIQTEIIHALLDHITASSDTVEMLLEYASRQFMEGHLKGIDEERQRHELAAHPQDKEALRSYHNIKQALRWADHY